MSDYICRVQHRSFAVGRNARTLIGRLRDLRRNRGHQRSDASHPPSHHPKSGSGTTTLDKTNSDKIVLLTNLLDVPAEIIAALYELHLLIKLFFRFSKQMLSCHHLPSNKPAGAMIQVYCAPIASLLMSLTLGDSVVASN